jgi:hypothetical protein
MCWDCYGVVIAVVFGGLACGLGGATMGVLWRERRA